jgi:hypothetical protein
MRTIKVSEALAALKKLSGAEQDLTTLAQFIAERHVAEAPPENTGLPCLYCGERLQRVNVGLNDTDTLLRVRVNADFSWKEFRALLGVLKMVGKGLM